MRSSRKTRAAWPLSNSGCRQESANSSMHVGGRLAKENGREIESENSSTFCSMLGSQPSLSTSSGKPCVQPIPGSFKEGQNISDQGNGEHTGTTQALPDRVLARLCDPHSKEFHTVLSHGGEQVSSGMAGEEGVPHKIRQCSLQSLTVTTKTSS